MGTSASVLYGSTAGTLDAALKTLWPQKKITTAMYEDAPLLGLIPKKTDFTGKNAVIAARYVGQQGRSATFATAQANYTSTAQVAFTVTRRHDYAVGRITGEAVRAAKGNEGSLVDGINDEMDTSMLALKRSLCAAIYGNGGGSLGQVASGQATPTITLTNRSDVVNFEVGQILAASAADGTSGALLNAGATIAITAIDRDAGTLTAAGNWTASIAALAANSYLFIAGDFDATNRGKVTGLGGWVPTTAPAAASNFFGVDRSVDVVRLAGLRYVGTGNPIEETIQIALSRAFENRIKPDVLMMNPADHNKLALSLGNRAIYDRAKSFDVPEVGYETLAVIGQGGRVKCIADASCPVGRGYGLKLDTWTLWSLGACPGILEEDGLSVLRVSNADEYEWRMGYFAQMVCKAPGENMVITF